MEKYVEIAKQMRESDNYIIDISVYDAKEILLITTLAKEDTIFEFFEQFKDMDVRRMYALIQYDEALKNLKESREYM